MTRHVYMLELAQLLSQVLTTFDELLADSDTTADFMEAAEAYLTDSAAGLQGDIRALYVSHTQPLLALYAARLQKQDSLQMTAQLATALAHVRSQLHSVVVDGMALHDGPYLDAIVAMYNAVLDGLVELSALDAEAAADLRTQLITEAAGRTLDAALERTETPLLHCLAWLKNGMELPVAWLHSRWQQWADEAVQL